MKELECNNLPAEKAEVAVSPRSEEAPKRTLAFGMTAAELGDLSKARTHNRRLHLAACLAPKDLRAWQAQQMRQQTEVEKH